MDFALGQLLDLVTSSGTVYRWQNFWIKENYNNYSFIPFGFSGLTTNRQADNIDATLLFPNNELSRQWALLAVQERWVAKVQIVLFDPEDKTKQTLLHNYVGQIATGGWGETAINIRLNTLLDAVGGEVPARRLTQELVGNLPTSSNIQLS